MKLGPKSKYLSYLNALPENLLRLEIHKLIKNKNYKYHNNYKWMLSQVGTRLWYIIFKEKRIFNL